MSQTQRTRSWLYKYSHDSATSSAPEPRHCLLHNPSEHSASRQAPNNLRQRRRTKITDREFPASAGNGTRSHHHRRHASVTMFRPCCRDCHSGRITYRSFLRRQAASHTTTLYSRLAAVDVFRGAGPWPPLKPEAQSSIFSKPLGTRLLFPCNCIGLHIIYKQLTRHIPVTDIPLSVKALPSSYCYCGRPIYRG